MVGPRRVVGSDHRDYHRAGGAAAFKAQGDGGAPARPGVGKGWGYGPNAPPPGTPAPSSSSTTIDWGDDDTSYQGNAARAHRASGRPSRYASAPPSGPSSHSNGGRPLPPHLANGASVAPPSLPPPSQPRPFQPSISRGLNPTSSSFSPAPVPVSAPLSSTADSFTPKVATLDMYKATPAQPQQAPEVVAPWSGFERTRTAIAEPVDNWAQGGSPFCAAEKKKAPPPPSMLRGYDDINASVGGFGGGGGRGGRQGARATSAFLRGGSGGGGTKTSKWASAPAEIEAGWAGETNGDAPAAAPASSIASSSQSTLPPPVPSTSIPTVTTAPPPPPAPTATRGPLFAASSTSTSRYATAPPTSTAPAPSAPATSKPSEGEEKPKAAPVQNGTAAVPVPDQNGETVVEQEKSEGVAAKEMEKLQEKTAETNVVPAPAAAPPQARTQGPPRRNLNNSTPPPSTSNSSFRSRTPLTPQQLQDRKDREEERQRRGASGGVRKEKKSIEEIDALMAKMRLKNEETRKKLAAVESDRSAFDAVATTERKRSEELEKAVREEREKGVKEEREKKERTRELQDAINAERARSAALKLSRIQGRAWDAEKLSSPSRTPQGTSPPQSGSTTPLAYPSVERDALLAAREREAEEKKRGERVLSSEEQEAVRQRDGVRGYEGGWETVEHVEEGGRRAELLR